MTNLPAAVAAVVVASAFIYHRFGGTSVAYLVGTGPDVSFAALHCKAHESLKWDTHAPSKIRSSVYYAEYHGHKPEHLARAYQLLRGLGSERFIFLAGDSSLDNKAWFDDTAEAVNGYEEVLYPASMKMDVCYWLNRIAAERKGPRQLATIMSAVEASTADDRAKAGLLAQDVFIRDHIGRDDYLIVSVGGNDIALNPTLATAVNMLLVTRSPAALIRAGVAPGLGYFTRFFTQRIEAIVRALVERQQPRRVLVRMIY